MFIFLFSLLLHTWWQKVISGNNFILKNCFLLHLAKVYRSLVPHFFSLSSSVCRLSLEQKEGYLCRGSFCVKC